MKCNILVAAACAAVSIASLPVHADPAAAEFASNEATVAPHVLSTEDVRLYREIFEDESSGQYAAAHVLIGQLSDSSLVGYAEAQKYLSPHGRRTSLAALASWIEEYGDLPVAPRIRELAVKRNRRHRIELAALPGAPRRVGGGYEESDTLRDPPLLSDAARTARVDIVAELKLLQPAAAEAALQALVAGNVAPPSDVAVLTQHVAASYLAQGQDDAAWRVATNISDTERAVAPMLEWDAGLAAYRLGKFADAAPHFETLMQLGDVPGWTRSAAAFWAARAHLLSGDPLRVVTLLNSAAREQPTFYGLLAERMLGREPQASFSDPVMDSAAFAALMQIPAAHRAVALWQVGRNDMIADEMNRALAEIDLRDAGAFAALSHRLDLPNLELRASETQAAKGVMLTGLYPVPRYTPPGGYQVDPCLLLAFARTESRFQSKAVSVAGARGVMQLMPGTARQMDGTMPGRGELDDPAFNLGLGQRYLQELIEQTNGNLLQLAAAYNAGPGALTHWLGSQPSIMNDPLLFIESLPVTETRNYIKRVMTYYWMYARRSNQNAPSLQETAEGKWPLYRPAALPASAPPAEAGPMRVSDAAH